MPFHFWLPAAMVAPTPVSVLLHAVAVVKAGVSTLLKVVVYIFGIKTAEFHRAAGYSARLFGALHAVNLRRWSRCRAAQSQGAARLLDHQPARLHRARGGTRHVVQRDRRGHAHRHACGGQDHLVLLGVGAIYVAAHKTEISQLDGIGRKMPITMAAFMIGSLSIIGLPPFGGTWEQVVSGSRLPRGGHQFVVAASMISSLLNVAYLMPIVARAFFKAPGGTDGTAKVGIAEAPLPCVLALSFTALLCTDTVHLPRLDRGPAAATRSGRLVGKGRMAP